MKNIERIRFMGNVLQFLRDAEPVAVWATLVVAIVAIFKKSK